MERFALIPAAATVLGMFLFFHPDVVHAMLERMFGMDFDHPVAKVVVFIALQPLLFWLVRLARGGRRAGSSANAVRK